MIFVTTNPWLKPTKPAVILFTAENKLRSGEKDILSQRYYHRSSHFVSLDTAALTFDPSHQ